MKAIFDIVDTLTSPFGVAAAVFGSLVYFVLLIAILITTPYFVGYFVVRALYDTAITLFDPISDKKYDDFADLNGASFTSSFVGGTVFLGLVLGLAVLSPALGISKYGDERYNFGLLVFVIGCVGFAGLHKWQEKKRRSDRPRIVKQCKESAEGGDARAQFYLGEYHLERAFIKGSIDEAVGWYLKSAEQGFVEAQCRLGEIYHSGKLVDQDTESGIGWLKRAAEQGQGEAQYFLGEIYFWGEGVDVDQYEAYKWYRMSAEQNNADAQSHMGLYFLRRSDIAKRDPVEAYAWFSLAARKGEKVYAYSECRDLKKTLSKKDFAKAKRRAFQLKCAIRRKNADAYARYIWRKLKIF